MAKYLTKLRKNVYYTERAEVSLELDLMGIEKIGRDYKKNEPNKTLRWIYGIKETLINDLQQELNRRLG